MNKIIAFLRDEEGLTTVEYAIAGGLVGAAVVGAFTSLGDQVGAFINYITSQISVPGAGTTTPPATP